MPQYRAYKLDSNGHVKLPHVFECDDDTGALDYANKLSKDSAASVELWQRARLVGRVDPEQ